MKNLIIESLHEGYNFLKKTTPKTKIMEKTISIIDVKPIDLLTFMKDNNIPENACFDGGDNGYDGLLSWDVKVPNMEEDRVKYIADKFNKGTAFKFVYNKLISNGYKRIGFNSTYLKEFKNTTPYDMFINKEMDKLVKYYSLFFKKD